MSGEAGKGDKPRNCFSKAFKDNYDMIFGNSEFKKQREKIQSRLYNEGWYTQSDYIKKCKNLEECEAYILEHCGVSYLYILEDL